MGKFGGSTLQFLHQGEMFEMLEMLIVASACRKIYSPKALKPIFACVVRVALDRKE